MREACTKFTCEAPGCATVVYAPDFPPDWKVFMDKDYCPLHTVTIEVDGVDVPAAGD